MPPPKKPQTYQEYAGFFTREMRRRAIEAGCLTIREASEWLNRWYGRDRNTSHRPPPYRRPE